MELSASEENGSRNRGPVVFVREYFREKALSEDFRVKVDVYPARFAEQVHFALRLTDHHSGFTSSDPTFSGLFSKGRPSQAIQGWIDGDYFDTASFPGSARFFLSERGLDIRFFKMLGGLVPPGGSLMVSYSLFSKESKIHRNTKSGLDRGCPPVVTPLGFLLFTAGCGMGFKDWYFAEGGREGPEKLQGYKPIDSKAAKAKAEQLLLDLKAFISSPLSDEDSLVQECKSRAKQVIAELEKSVWAEK